MEIESRVELPDGHLVNLSPRPQPHGQYQAYRANYATELSAHSPSRPSRYNYSDTYPEFPSSFGPDDTMFHKAKATKLPVPKTFTDRGKDQRNQTPSPTAIPKPSPTTYSSGGSSGPSTQSGDRGREHSWRKLRDRFEKESSPLSQRSSYVRSRKSDQTGSPDHSNSRRPTKGQTTNRGGQSSIPSPQGNRKATQNARHDSSVNTAGKKNLGTRSISGIPHQSEKSDYTESSHDSHSSISPVSADESVADWEDRFVVHMPSAKDPNPPTMTTQQISEYQKNIERKKRERRRGRISNVSAALSSRNASSDREQSSQPSQQSQSDLNAESYKTNNGRSAQAQADTDRQQVAASQSQNPQAPAQKKNYYSPEEIGKNRISTIWEESSPSKPRDKRSVKNDGSFLGCKEINGPGTKNPDEILLFSSAHESEHLQPRPLAIGGKKKPKGETRMDVHQTQLKVEEKDNLHEEWTEISQNSKHAQCLKQSSKTLCQDPDCSDPEISRPDSQGSSKENSHPRESFESAKEQPEDNRGEDDVFIITPTVTRTAIPSSEKKPLSLKTHGLRRPGGTGQSGTGEAVKAVRAKAQVVSTPSGLRPAGGAWQSKSTAPSTASSKTTPLSSIPKPKDSPTSKQAPQSKDGPPRDTPSKDTSSTETSVEEPQSKETPSKDTPSKDPSPKDKIDPEKNNSQPTSSIRGFIRTSGLGRSGGIVRSPTDSLATILRNGTESLRNRAESFRNANGSLYFSSRKGSPVSLTSAPSRDNSESSRSERSFRSALSSVKDTPPSSAKPSPIKRPSPAAKRVSIDKAPPQEITPPREKRTPRQSSPPRQKTPTPSRAKAPSRDASPSAEEQRLAAEKQARAERLEKFKEEARLRRANKMAASIESENMGDKTVEKEIAELDGHQVTGSKRYLHSNITDVCDDLREGLHPGDKDESVKEGANALALSMVFEIMVMAITQMHKAVHNGTDSQYAKVLINNVLNMARHCHRVFTRVYRVISEYQATGKWPRAKNDKAISGFLMELLQAVLYLFVLGFGALVVGRAASYVLLVGSWMLWFAKPFAWAVQGIGRALVA